MEIFAFGGVTEQERKIGQRYRLNIALELDLTLPGETDSLDHTVSYADVFDVARRTLRERPFNLVESAAARLATELLGQFDVREVTVRLSKLLPPVDGVLEAAGVEVTRRREQPVDHIPAGG
jgi:dihydroneopterin aldolase